MELLEHNENRAYRLTRTEVALAISVFLGIDATFKLDDADITHDGADIFLTVYFTRPATD